MGRYNTRLITARRSYTMKEVRSLFGITRDTWQRWLKEGLAVVEQNTVPTLVLGSTLKAFLGGMGKKAKLGPDEFYCTYCHNIVSARPGTEWIEKSGKKIGRGNYDLMIKFAECAICGGRAQRFLPVVNQTNTVLNITEGKPHLQALETQKLSHE